MIGAPAAMTTNSPAAVVSHVSKNGKSNASFNSHAMKNIVIVNTIVLMVIRAHTFLTYLIEKMVINKAMNDCPTPKIRSYATIGEKKRFVKKTPNTMPYKYFLLNTTRWFNISDTRNCIFVNPKGCISIDTAIYTAANMPFTTSVLMFISLSPSF
jgi:hypothetical protein